MATMERRKTMTLNWEGLGDDDDDDHFFETRNRLSTAVPLDLICEDDDDDFEDSRISFTSTLSTKPRMSNFTANFTAKPNYDIWMAAPGSITERRRRLLGSMGLDENKELLQATSAAIARAITRKFESKNANNNNNYHYANNMSIKNNNVNHTKRTTTVRIASTVQRHKPPQPHQPHQSHQSHQPSQPPQPSQSSQPSRTPIFVLVRSRSEGDMDSFSLEKLRKEAFIGKVSKQRLTRTATEIVRRRHVGVEKRRIIMRDAAVDTARQMVSPAMPMTGLGAFFLIKNLDTGKEFIVKEYGEDGAWNRLSDLQTGKQLTMEEFEQTVGHSAAVKEAMRRPKAARDSKKLMSNSYISRSLKLSKRRGASLLKNIKGVASGKNMKGAGSGSMTERDRETAAPAPAAADQKSAAQGQNEWVRVRQTGKSQKELSALHLCQEFEAHDGCVWVLRFSLDGRYLASAGEDKDIHVWEVQECEVMSLKPEEGNLTPIHPTLLSERSEAPPLSSDKKKKGKNGSKRISAIPDFVHVPETVFTLSDKPYCTFTGHLDEVLDLSWSKSQLLLSSSMDKTVRLWDLETQACLKFFAHNDYVTCVQFNPVDESHFISGSLDAKVRMWNIPGRHVVDWIDIHDLVTAVAYSPDGQGIVVGTQKGYYRSYSIDDYKLTQSGTVELRNKKKSQLKKVTGFQFSPNNPSEVLVSSADSRIRIVDGSQVLQKFKGFRNATSQMAASFTPNGKYIISPSEDSQVFVWKYEETIKPNPGKGRNVVVNQSHEHFLCKDISVAIPWPGTIRGDPPPSLSGPNKKNPKRPSQEDILPPVAETKRMLPPLPKKSVPSAAESSPSSPDADPAAISRTESGSGDSSRNNKSMLPPLPKKSNHQATESDTIPTDEELEAITTDTGLGDSFTSGSEGASAMHDSAWGMVIVTAGFGGEIRCYQNFGIPRKMRQANLFMGPT